MEWSVQRRPRRTFDFTHARPATFLVDVATRFESEIRVQYGTKIGNAKALASLLKLGVESGGTIRLLASGREAQAALAALKQAVESGLGEEEEMEALPAKISAWTQQSSVRAITGVAASPGLAIGHLFQFPSEQDHGKRHTARRGHREKCVQASAGKLRATNSANRRDRFPGTRKQRLF